MDFNHPLCQNNKDFFGYTVFTFKMNDVPIRFVTEKDAMHVVEKQRNSQDTQLKDAIALLKQWHQMYKKFSGTPEDSLIRFEKKVKRLLAQQR